MSPTSEPRRPRRGHPRSEHTVAADAGIHLIASQLLDGLTAGDVPPALVHLAPADGDAFDLGLLPLEGRHPTELLLGFTAPETWHALGVVSSGWAYPIAERAGNDRTRRRVHVVSMLSRSGEVAHRTHVDDDPTTSASLSADSPVGEQIDLLRRCLDLPTDPPPGDANAYWAVEWLSGVLGIDAPTWSDVLDAHPAMRLLAAGDELRSIDFVEVVTSFVRVCDWPRLRRLAGDDLFPAPELTASQARWLDDGSFARFLLNRCPPLDLVRRQAIEHLPGHLAERLVDLLGELGVPRRSWPDDIGGTAA